MRSAYEELVALCEVSLELVRDEQYAALEPVHEATRALIAGLPEKPPPSATAPLQRVAALDAEKRDLLEQRIGLVRGALVKIQHGRKALDGYAQQDARARVDRTG
jgi:hypothetical protein